MSPKVLEHLLSNLNCVRDTAKELGLDSLVLAHVSGWLEKEEVLRQVKHSADKTINLIKSQDSCYKDALIRTAFLGSHENEILSTISRLGRVIKQDEYFTICAIDNVPVGVSQHFVGYWKLYHNNSISQLGRKVLDKAYPAYFINNEWVTYES